MVVEWGIEDGPCCFIGIYGKSGPAIGVFEAYVALFGSKTGRGFSRSGFKTSDQVQGLPLMRGFRI
jgi:hypothetical protein